jgi:DNA recombination protein RmuC
MDPVLAIIVGIVIGVVIGALAATVFAARSAAQRAATADPAADARIDPAILEAEHATALVNLRAQEQGRQAELGSRLAGVLATAEGLERQLEAQRSQYRDLVDRHAAEELSRAARERAENTVLQALTPVQETLRTMQLKVTELETQRSLQHGELSQQLRSAAESEERLRSTADSLAAALKNNSTRGVWGETQLRAVVEAAGLLQRVNFDVQSSIVSDRGAGRPDMVVNLPGGKCIAVDAKVPFNAYIEANAIPVTADDGTLTHRAALMKRHVKAVRDHITTLGSKAYWEGLEASPEMVIAFIPSESLLSSALESDPTIMEFAFSKRVALASPVTLFAVLKTVAVSWQHSVVTEEAKSLFDISRELYSRLSTMAQHVEKLGRSVKATVNDYNRFVGSLERQVLPSARKLNVLDESKVIGALEVVEESTRDLTAPELLAPLPEKKIATIDRELRSLDETGIHAGPDRFGLTLPGLDDVADEEGTRSA